LVLRLFISLTTITPSLISSRISLICVRIVNACVNGVFLSNHDIHEL
jgi:hypothetical protein